MKIFISWSGDLSRELGEALRDWLPAVLQNVKPFFTPNDIEKGARWSKDIAKELEDSSVGIFCLTKENLNKPWIMFEAGALSKKLDTSRVCPILFGVDNADVEGPLVQFQAAPFDEREIRKLIKTLNACLGDQRLEETVLNDVFGMWWPKLNEKVINILNKYDNKKDKPSSRSDREILEEILQLSRLNVSSSRRNVRSIIGPGPLAHIIKIVNKTIGSIKEGASSTTTINILSEIRKPIDYLLHKSDMSEEDKHRIIDELDSISFQEDLNEPEGTIEI